jgi:hypothetical protein
MYDMAIPQRSMLLGDLMRRRILVLDGAMGTMIQNPQPDGGRLRRIQYEGCNEQLNLTRPDVVADIHAAYLEAGADLISTNTFGCARVLAEYGLAEGATISPWPPHGSAARPWTVSTRRTGRASPSGRWGREPGRSPSPPT